MQMNNNTIREREKSQTFDKNSKFIFKQSELVFMFVAKTRSMNKRVQRVFSREDKNSLTTISC